MRRSFILILIFCGLSILLLMPFAQQWFHFVREVKLEGAFIPKPKPVLSSDNWFSGKFQKEAEEYLNESFGFRGLFVRLNNQLAFSLFNMANADNIVVGIDNYLFQRPTIPAHFGGNFIGEELIKTKTQRLKFISDTLLKLNKNLILILGTGKGTFFSDFIPEKLRTVKGITNYEYFSDCAQKSDLSYIDFNKYFIDKKSNSPYPLFPQYGIHWSRYGGYVVTDSLLHFIESVRNIDLPDIILDTIEFRQPENEDYDIAGGMNLLFRLKSFDMAYPKIHYESDSGKSKPSVLVIGDSFYWGLLNMDITKAFSRSEFWFYNKRGTAGALRELSPETKMKMAEEMIKFDCVILIATASNFPDLGWGFIESSYCYFMGLPMNAADSILFQDEVASIKFRIKSDPDRMKRIADMASKNNISVDSMLTERAIQRVKQRLNKNR